MRHNIVLYNSEMHPYELSSRKASSLPDAPDVRVVGGPDSLEVTLTLHPGGSRLSPQVGQVPYVLLKVTLCPPFPCKVRLSFPRTWRGTAQLGHRGCSSLEVLPHSRLLLSCAASCRTCASNCIIRWCTSSSISTKVALGCARRQLFDVGQDLFTFF